MAFLEMYESTNNIGRLCFVNPTKEERFYLWLILTVVCGLQIFKYIVNGVFYLSSKVMTLEDNKEYNKIFLL